MLKFNKGDEFMIIEIPKIEEWKEVNKIAKQVHEMHVAWRPDIFVSVEDVIEKERYEMLIQNENIYIIKEDKNIIGYATIERKEREVHGMHYRKIISIEAIAIDEKYRGKGYGTELINYIIDLGKKENYTDLYLTVNEENENAIQLYEKIGLKVKNIAYSMKIH